MTKELDRAKEVFQNLRGSGKLRDTRQRNEILRILLSSDRHLTAEELYVSAKKTNPGIGFATVYRTLRLLLENGLVNEIKIGRESAKYEAAMQEHHDHLICLRCGSFTEIHNDGLEKLQERLAAQHGFTPLKHKLEIYGTCGKCSGKKANQ